jgi:hypothetical protein
MGIIATTALLHVLGTGTATTEAARSLIEKFDRRRADIIQTNELKGKILPAGSI